MKINIRQAFFMKLSQSETIGYEIETTAYEIEKFINYLS